ncbi:PRAME family member 8-like [Arvicanthis niloticus]|uniref:PRAME family member 8-like n=1 Tax=Arvicanthis niloticus TaxID=61156 RepID=UPI0014875FA3|nr:PRAME family member 8-like isoform X1 [Arvicanthis niloticus]
MSLQNPPTLQKLARQSLLSSEALAMSSVKELPCGLFPALFKDAFTGRHTNLVKAMVAAWPFPCLPVGALMKTPDLETFHAVLDGVDMRLTRKFHPRGKVQVLDLRNVHHAFWNIWAGTEDGSCSSETFNEKPGLKVLPRYGLRRQVKVVADLCLRPRLDETQACFLKWAQQRKDSLYLCCTKMQIWAMPVNFIKEILTVFHPEHIEELELNTEWNVFKLAQFAPCFGQMRNLRKLLLAPLYKNVFKIANSTGDREDKCVKEFISLFSKFNCLQHLSMSGIHFLTDHMNQVFRCLLTPLVTLSISHYKISQSDLDSFCYCESLFQLKHLEMRGVVLRDLDFMPLRGLLEKVADTLETLDLQGCRMKDSQLSALLPVLRQCSQLTKVNFYNNDFSMLVLKDFLQHTANWSKMNVEQYPAPLECYDELAHVSREMFAHLSQELMDTLRAIRQPESISFATGSCHKCGEHCVYGQGARLCGCWQ